jgi:hypothetical protein
MTLILDAGGVSALACRRAILNELRRQGMWPPQVPAVVLTEALTGDHRRDFQTNQLLRLCQIRDVTESVSRTGARLRTATGRAGTISAVDAVVASYATTRPVPVVLTSDPGDLNALVADVPGHVVVASV